MTIMHMRERIQRLHYHSLVILVILSLLGILFNNSSYNNILNAAPAPKPKTLKEIIVGKWTCKWGMYTYVLIFEKDGKYQAFGEDRLYKGKWYILHNLLVIREHIVDNEEPSISSYELWIVKFNKKEIICDSYKLKKIK